MNTAMSIMINKIIETGTEEDIELLFTEIRGINDNYFKMKNKTILKRILNKDDTILGNLSFTRFTDFIQKHMDLCIIMPLHTISETSENSIVKKIFANGTEKEIDKFFERISNHNLNHLDYIPLLIKKASEKPIRSAYLLAANTKSWGSPPITEQDKLYETILQDPEAIVIYFERKHGINRCPQAEAVLKKAPDEYKFRYLEATILCDKINKKYTSAAAVFFDKIMEFDKTQTRIKR